ncbi:hypothetical protein TSMEX_005499 [Taenia solium]|eukprot:TsM_000608000 transcript=TsM_000608000 gene=TsM_000608000
MAGGSRKSSGRILMIDEAESPDDGPNDAMVILKRQEENGQLPLLILRRGYSQNTSTLRQLGANPNWWRVQLFSRNSQLPKSQEFDLVHQRLHSPYHYLFFNRAQSFRNPLDDFLSPPGRKYEAQSTLVVRFCLNDSGLQMPDSGLAVFTTLLKAKLACSIRLPTSRNAPTFYARNSYGKLKEESEVISGGALGKAVIIYGQIVDLEGSTGETYGIHGEEQYWREDEQIAG